MQWIIYGLFAAVLGYLLRRQYYIERTLDDVSAHLNTMKDILISGELTSEDDFNFLVARYKRRLRFSKMSPKERKNAIEATEQFINNL